MELKKRAFRPESGRPTVDTYDIIGLLCSDPGGKPAEVEYSAELQPPHPFHDATPHLIDVRR